MKRRTSLTFFIGCAALCGTFLLLTSSTGEEEIKGVSPRLVPASGTPPRVVHTPVGRVTDTLVPTSAQTSRTQLPHPNLIHDMNQVITIAPAPTPVPPPAAPVAAPAPPPPPPAPIPTTTTTTQPPAPAAPVVNDGGWQQVAICEEGGSNSPTYGYFGIMPSSWAAYGGTAYSATAGGSSWATQVMIGDKINGGNAPYAPSGCAAAGYGGW
jgi:hypothetical protein